MISEQKQSELQRHRAILLATLDYLEEKYSGSFVFDQIDPQKEFYQQQKVQTEKYFKQRRLDRMQQRLSNLIKGLQDRVDLKFASFIAEKTGYDIDIFEDLPKRFDATVAQNKIRSQSDLNEVSLLLNFYDETSANGQEVEKLKSLLIDYSNRTNETSRNLKGKYSEVISRVEKDGIEEVTIRVMSGSKSKHHKEHEIISPDGKRKLLVVQYGTTKHSSTYVAIQFPTSYGAIYGISGICPDVKAWWKDNSTIVIESRKEYEPNTRCKEVRSFEDIIKIEYIEH